MGFSSVVERHWQARQRFTSSLGYAAYLYDRALRRVRRLPLPARHQVIAVNLRAHAAPYFVRLGSTDMLVLEEMFQTAEYRFVESLNEVRCIVDLGANAGFSLRYWNRLFPEARMLAVEPEPQNVRMCQLNVAAALFSEQVTVVPACVGGTRRKVNLQGDEEWAYRMNELRTGHEQTVDVLPLSELLEIYFPNETIDLLKCDIEGAERELFADCRSWIPRVRAIAIELHPPYGREDLLADLNLAGAYFEVVAEVAAKAPPVLLLQRRD